jgi:two-component system, cell cycle response regulator
MIFGRFISHLTIYRGFDTLPAQVFPESSGLKMAESDSKLTVLVADDSAIFRQLVEHSLSRKSYSLLLAKSGREAIELFAKYNPPLVIVDWMMPDLTGIEICRHIRRAQESYTYIVILTAMSQKAKLVEGLSAGADDFLTKPFDSDELLARVDVGTRVVLLHRELEAKNRLLEELAVTDTLTNLPNRRGIEGWATRQLSGAARYGFTFWLVMADLDEFKTVNDRFGHQAGDKVLVAFAELLRRNTRKSDICGRTGGEEFLFILTHSTRENAFMVVERIRAELSQIVFELGGQSVSVTASFGIAEYKQNVDQTLDELVREADVALYEAKGAGRNCVKISAS